MWRRVHSLASSCVLALSPPSTWTDARRASNRPQYPLAGVGVQMYGRRCRLHAWTGAWSQRMSCPSRVWCSSRSSHRYGHCASASSNARARLIWRWRARAPCLSRADGPRLSSQPTLTSSYTQTYTMSHLTSSSSAVVVTMPPRRSWGACGAGRSLVRLPDCLRQGLWSGPSSSAMTQLLRSSRRPSGGHS